MLPLLLTAFADWLNVTFQSFDHAILQFAHNMYLSAAGGFFKVILTFFTYLGSEGIFFLALGVVLMCFKKTRKIGAGIVLAVAVGAVFTNLCIKKIVARPRPYNATDEYNSWWLACNGKLESEFSFPSGHATASFATATALFVFGNKKYSWSGYIVALIIGFSRNFLMVHYPTDIIAGLIVGCISGVIASGIVWVIWHKIGGKLGEFIREFDVIDLFKKLKNNKKEENTQE